MWQKIKCWFGFHPKLKLLKSYCAYGIRGGCGFRCSKCKYYKKVWYCPECKRKV